MSTARQRAKWRAASAKWKVRHPDYAKQQYRKQKSKVAARIKKRFASKSGTRRRYQKRWAANRRKQRLAGKTHCAICRKRLTQAFIDHCYATAKRICKHRVDKACERCMRDVLCPSCNHVLGIFKEDIQLLERAKQYLRKWRRILGKRG